MHFWGMWTPQIEKFFAHMLDYTSQRKFNKQFWRENLRSLKKYERMYP